MHRCVRPRSRSASNVLADAADRKKDPRLLIGSSARKFLFEIGCLRLKILELVHQLIADVSRVCLNAYRDHTRRERWLEDLEPVDLAGGKTEVK